jgi:hypothetical protein
MTALRSEWGGIRRWQERVTWAGRKEHGAAPAAVKEGLEEQETGQRRWEPELHRLEGIALFGLNRIEEGQSALEEALCVARRQEAKSYELRAAASLALLWGERGRRAEARDLLAPVYGWFTEGFDTADLKEAKALLEELTCTGDGIVVNGWRPSRPSRSLQSRGERDGRARSGTWRADEGS